jgi:hypothetical protein
MNVARGSALIGPAALCDHHAAEDAMVSTCTNASVVLVARHAGGNMSRRKLVLGLSAYAYCGAIWLVCDGGSSGCDANLSVRFRSDGPSTFAQAWSNRRSPKWPASAQGLRPPLRQLGRHRVHPIPQRLRRAAKHAGTFLRDAREPGCREWQISQPPQVQHKSARLSVVAGGGWRRNSGSWRRSRNPVLRSPQWRGGMRSVGGCCGTGASRSDAAR